MNRFFPRDIIHLTPTLKAYVCDEEGCAELDALEAQFSCQIQVTKNALSINSLAHSREDVKSIDAILTQKAQKWFCQRKIREVALSASHTYKCSMVLPKPYAAVVQLYLVDIKRASKQCDFIINHMSGEVMLFGTDQAVGRARSRIIDHLTDYFCSLSIEIPEVEKIRTSWSGTPTTPTTQDKQCMENETFFLDEMLKEIEKASQQTAPSVSSIINMPQYGNPVDSLESVTVWITNASAASIMSNKGQLRKRIEMEAHCLVVVRKDYESFGMMPVDIYGKDKDVCVAGQRIIEEMFKVKTNEEKFSPDRNGKRNIFRDQKKILLELSPKK